MHFSALRFRSTRCQQFPLSPFISPFFPSLFLSLPRFLSPYLAANPPVPSCVACISLRRTYVRPCNPVRHPRPIYSLVPLTICFCHPPVSLPSPSRLFPSCISLVRPRLVIYRVLPLPPPSLSLPLSLQSPVHPFQPTRRPLRRVCNHPPSAHYPTGSIGSSLSPFLSSSTSSSTMTTEGHAPKSLIV